MDNHLGVPTVRSEIMESGFAICREADGARRNASRPSTRSIAQRLKWAGSAATINTAAENRWRAVSADVRKPAQHHEEATRHSDAKRPFIRCSE